MTNPTRLIAIAVIILSLAACKTEIEEAIAEYDLAKQNTIQPEDKCRAAQRVKELYLQDGDAQNYETWQIIEFGACTKGQ